MVKPNPVNRGVIPGQLSLWLPGAVLLLLAGSLTWMALLLTFSGYQELIYYLKTSYPDLFLVDRLDRDYFTVAQYQGGRLILQWASASSLGLLLLWWRFRVVAATYATQMTLWSG